MMDAQTIEDAKKACLKQNFGGVLDAHEQALLNRYLETEDGKQYMNDSNDMKNLLSDVAVVTATQPIDSAQMVRDFEAMMRDRLRTTRRNLPWGFALTSGVWGLVGYLCLDTGKQRLEVMGWSLIGLSLVFAVFVVAVWRKQTSLLEDDDLIVRLDEDKQLRKTTAVRVRGIVLSVLLLAVLGYGVAEAAGLTGILCWVAVSTLLLYLGYHAYTAQKRKDQDLWDWWEGR